MADVTYNLFYMTDDLLLEPEANYLVSLFKSRSGRNKSNNQEEDEQEEDSEDDEHDDKSQEEEEEREEKEVRRKPAKTGIFARLQELDDSEMP